MKILIVDDEEMIRDVLREYVEFEGNEAFEAADGMEAVRLCRENDYDLVLMDVMMPHLDGFSAVKEVKKAKDVPVIMLSARGAHQRGNQTPQGQPYGQRNPQIRGFGSGYGRQTRLRGRSKSRTYP